MIEFVFNEKRAAQAAARLLRRHGGPMEYFKLVKLLYLADRKIFIEIGRPITGDCMVSMEHGPVLSGVYDLIKGDRAGDGSWGAYVRPRQGFSVSWTGCEDAEELSDRERDVLDEIYGEFGSLHWWDLRNETHRLAEWHDPDKSSAPIDPAEILASSGMTDAEIDVVAQETAEITGFMKKYAG